jgi:uncharacterized protein (TIGR04168 family)
MNELNQPRLTRIAVIGDVHELWDEQDEAALKHLKVDLVLFVGDIGNESVELVRSIAALDLPKAVVLGNHDAWYNATDWGIKQCPYDRKKEDRVQQQLDLLGVTHVGYGKLDFPELQLSVVGSRPFSWGGSVWRNVDFYRQRYGVRNFEESTARIVDAASQAVYDTMIFLGHCGPTGLGEHPEAPCGRDWKPLGGDFGDPDLAGAIAQVRQTGKAIPLVTFGHMHHQLRHTKDQLRQPIDMQDDTLYLNAASVPRIVNQGGHYWRNFSLVTLQDGIVTQASLLWLDQNFDTVSEQVLYNHTDSILVQELSSASA